MRLTRKIFLIAAAAILLFPLGFGLYLAFCPKIALWHPGETLVLGQEGQTKAVHRGNLESYISLKSLRPEIPSYLIGLEDQNFYHHGGYDIARTVKSALDNLSRGRIVSGGSTITQQLARLIFLNNAKTLKRKVDELVYARRLERSLSKDEILEAYLNSVYFGKNLYGLGSAARTYYSVGADELTDAEAISLFAILKAPNSLAPDTASDKFQAAYSEACLRLYERGFLTAEKYTELIFAPPKPLQSPASDDDGFLYGYDRIERELTRLGIDDDAVGKTVVTTLDSDLQTYIQDLIREIEFENGLEAAVVVLRPEDGAILALVGGLSRSTDSFNRALDGVTQIGSTVKPILYLQALEQGFTPLTGLVSAPTVFHIDGQGDYAPENANGRYADREISMVEALSLSDNIYAAKTTLLVGSKALGGKLKAVGIKTEEASVSQGLGSISLSPLTLTAIYGALANRGVYHEPYIVSRVEERDRLLYRHGTDGGIRLFGRRESLLMAHMLLSPYDPAFQSYATPTMLGYKPRCRFAVKTGTTKTSSLVMGYNPRYVIGVYVGLDNEDDGAEISFDRTLAKRFFQRIADKVMEGQKDVFYETSGLKGFTITNRTSGIKSATYYR